MTDKLQPGEMKPERVPNVSAPALLLSIFILFPTETVRAQDFEYSIADGGVTITNYIGDGGEVVVPEMIDGSPVIAIGERAFRLSYFLTGITIPESVESIGEKAFDTCLNLLRVDLPDSVTSLGVEAFRGCYQLTDAVIPNGITSLPDYLFSGCNALEGLVIPPRVTSIGRSAFESCDALEKIEVPEGVTSIGTSAFASCDGLTDVILPATITDFGTLSFGACRNLSNVTLADGLTTIGVSAFSSCEGLAEIAIPESVTAIGHEAFANSGLTSITLPSDITTGYGILWGCRSLAEVHFSGSIDRIGPLMFDDCRLLKEVAIPDGAASIGSRAFAFCSSLTDVSVPSSVTSIGKEAFLKCGKLTGITIGDGLTHIDDNAFERCSKLARLTFPTSLIDIGDEAFLDCGGLREIFFEGDAPSFGQSVFTGAFSATVYYRSGTKGWEGLFGIRPRSSLFTEGFSYEISEGGVGITKYLGGSTTPDIPGRIDGLRVTSISADAFAGHGEIISITIPASVSSIGENAFRACTNLLEVYFEGDAPILSGSVFSELGASAFYLPGTDGWGADFGGLPTSELAAEFAHTSGGGETTITGYFGAEDLVVIPTTLGGLPVTAISSEAFANRDDLTSIVIPEGVRSIAPQAFSGCVRLVSIDLPTTIGNLGLRTFSGCTSLESIVIPSGVTTIDDQVFLGCSRLAGVYFEGDAPVAGGTSIFGGTESLTAFYLASGSGWGASYARQSTAPWTPGIGRVDVVHLGAAAIDVSWNGFQLGDGYVIESSSDGRFWATVPGFDGIGRTRASVPRIASTTRRLLRVRAR